MQQQTLLPATRARTPPPPPCCEALAPLKWARHAPTVDRRAGAAQSASIVGRTDTIPWPGRVSIQWALACLEQRWPEGADSLLGTGRGAAFGAPLSLREALVKNQLNAPEFFFSQTAS